ncbi:taurine ABC transporter substrate-binding protein [Pseudomonas fragi]|jgi:taurine transport system substrate-binding protein|uniref:Taurine ABC transporter substrate-binding protein n=1 Tax=Pseudomonas fragi TaxID=296 RepID=A0A9Q5B0L4_PSEFR|nr:taurine ABC transporter substrate-binding protein [Pseudomonas fragi]MBM1202255.1 taurine ABC transporter substrate-binding protein [Pseudomonas fragi]NNB26068.1 taurine ABC transporter substrate-binding protein [Pseudomonas fragi]NNB34435.1 taurine ABC transporter substrate-binding protein [Pseudomonas fragi]NNB50024.1 taurine ABC transporter substrate-binding protein [Pseudomonas fragi]PAA10178.1 taurine ABC transporter substrate-binding protein [Pseudomonas fragi]
MLKPLNKWIRRAVLLPLTAVALVANAQAQTVTIGVQSMFAPWKDAIAQKQFEKATGWDIKWRNFDSGGDVMMAMASGDVQIGVAGSSPIAAAVSRGVDAQLFWILDNIADAEALVVRNGSGIVAPQDLAGKTLAVPFVSTTHFHALFALEQFGLTGKVKVINLQPSDIPAAWERGDIDAAFIWDPALGRLKQSGHVLLTSGQLTDWGKATFDGLVVDKQFAAANGPGMQAFTQVLQDSTANYVAAPKTWTAESPQVINVAKQSGAKPEEVPPVLALYQFPLASEQAGPTWLGGGAAKALAATAEFLKAQKKIPALLPDYSAAINPTFVQNAQ